MDVQHPHVPSKRRLSLSEQVEQRRKARIKRLARVRSVAEEGWQYAGSKDRFSLPHQPSCSIPATFKFSRASSPADIFRSILSPSLVNDVLKRRSIEFNGFYRNKGQLRQSRVVLTPMRFTNISLSEFSSKALIVSIFEERVGFDPKSKHLLAHKKSLLAGPAT